MRKIPRFYEELACEMTGCVPAQLFSDDQSGEPVLARQLCCYFKKETTGLSYAKIGARYDRGHSNTLIGNRTLHDRIETDKEIKELVDEYMEKCIQMNKIILEDKTGVSIIKEHGIEVFVNEQNKIFIKYINLCNRFIDGKATDDEVMEALAEVDDAVARIRFNFTR